MCRILSVIGVDPSLRHGAVTRVDFKMSNTNLGFHDSKVLYTWSKANPHSLGIDSHPTQIHGLLAEIVKRLLPYSKKNWIGMHLGIDWDHTSGHWGSRRKQIAQVSYLTGALASTSEFLGFEVEWIAPKEVRALLGCSPKDSKEQVFIAAGEEIPGFKSVERMLRGMDPDCDIRDSILIGWAMAKKFLTQVD